MAEEQVKSKSRHPARGILVTVLLVLVTMASVSFLAIYQLAKAEAYARYIGIKNVSAERIAKIIRGTEINANNIFDEVSSHLDNSEGVINAMRAKANLNYDVRGYFAAFAPNYFPDKGTWFEPYIYQPEHGGFEYKQVGGARHNYTKSPWYLRAMDTGHSFWADPYYYYDGTSMSGHYCTFIKPIFDNQGNLACVCGADLKFEWLSRELDWGDEANRNNKVLNKYLPNTEHDLFTVILGKDGSCLAHPENKTITITDEKVLKDMEHKLSGMTEMEVNNVPCTVYYGPIEYIDWTVAVVVPQEDLLSPLMPIALGLLILIIIGLIIVWLICRKL